MNEFAQAVPRLDTLSKELGNKIGRMLESRGKITREEFKSIIAVQNERDLRFGDAALMLGLVQREDIDAVLAEQFAYTSPPDRDSKLDPRLIAAFQPDSTQAEALRSLRSELLLRYFNRGSHLSLAIVGAEDAAGIALTAANLAITFAQLGIRTLLVDGNLRAPQLHNLFGHSERNPGLSDLIAARTLVEPIAIPSLGSVVADGGTLVANLGMRAARNVVQKERHRRIDRVQPVHPTDGLIGHERPGPSGDILPTGAQGTRVGSGI